MHSSSAVSSPRMYPPGETNTSTSSRRPLPQASGPMTPASRSASISARSTCSSGPYSCRMNTQPCSAPTTAMPSSRPSSTRCGWVARIWRSLNVPGSDSSALQIAYLTSPGCVPRHQPPLLPGREPGAAHPAQLGVLQRRHDGVRVELARQQRAQRGVPLGHARSRRVGVVRPRLGALVRGSGADLARPGSGDERLGVPDGRGPFVDGDRGRDVAPAQAGHLHQLDVGVLAVARAQLGQPGVAVAQEAGQVVADVQRHLRRRLGAEVRVERDQALDLVERAARVAGQLLQLLAGQPAQPGLDRVERRDQRRARELPGPPLHPGHPARPDLGRPVGHLRHDSLLAALGGVVPWRAVLNGDLASSVTSAPPTAPPARRRT